MFVRADGEIHGGFCDGGGEGGADANEDPISVLDEPTNVVINAFCAYHECPYNPEQNVGVTLGLYVFPEEEVCSEQIPHGIRVKEGHCNAGRKTREGDIGYEDVCERDCADSERAASGYRGAPSGGPVAL